MKKVFFFLLIVVIAVFTFFKMHNDAKRVALKEVVEKSAAVSQLIKSQGYDPNLNVIVLQYLETLLIKMSSRDQLKLPLFDSFEKKIALSDFFDVALSYRKALLAHNGDDVTLNTKKKDEIATFIGKCDAIFKGYAELDSEDIAAEEINTEWQNVYRPKFFLEDDDLPEDESEDSGAEVTEAFDQFQVKDGKLVDTRTRYRKSFITEIVKKKIPPADLANHIGAEFKLRLMNGKLEKGKLLAADNEWVKLKIRFGAGDIARKIKLTDIKSAVKIIELKKKRVE